MPVQSSLQFLSYLVMWHNIHQGLRLLVTWPLLILTMLPTAGLIQMLLHVVLTHVVLMCPMLLLLLVKDIRALKPLKQVPLCFLVVLLSPPLSH